jgi:hypothetical protein
MSDLGTRIRHHYEDTTPSIDIDAIVDRMETRQARPKPQVRRGLAIAFVAAVLVLIAVAIPMLLNNPSEAPVISHSLPSPTTLAPAETTIPTPTTATVSPTTTLSPPTTLPPAWSTFTESDGAPAGRIHQVLAVPDGSVWVIGDGGIARYDDEWETVTPPEDLVADPMALPDPEAFLNHRQATVRVAAGADGSVWFSHFGGVHRYLEGTWSSYPSPVEDPDGLAMALPPIEIGVMGNGSVWISAGDMIWTLDESAWVIVDDEFAPTTDWGSGNNLGAYEIVIADDGALWISTNGPESGLIRYDGIEATVEPYAWEGFYLAEVRAATADGAWIVAGYGEPDRRLIYISEDGWVEYPLGDTTDVAVGPDGTVWVAVTAEPIDPCGGYCGPVEPVSEAGVYRYDGTNWVHYTTEDGLASNGLLSVSVGDDGTVWFGTTAGISRLLPEHADSGGQTIDW